MSFKHEDLAAWLEHIERNGIGALGEHRNAVDGEVEAAALVVRLAAQFNAAQAGTRAGFGSAQLWLVNYQVCSMLVIHSIWVLAFHLSLVALKCVALTSLNM